jgi:hypothetical protein
MPDSVSPANISYGSFGRMDDIGGFRRVVEITSLGERKGDWFGMRMGWLTAGHSFQPADYLKEGVPIIVEKLTRRFLPSGH